MNNKAKVKAANTELSKKKAELAKKFKFQEVKVNCSECNLKNNLRINLQKRVKQETKKLPIWDWENKSWSRDKQNKKIRAETLVGDKPTSKVARTAFKCPCGHHNEIALDKLGIDFEW